ncbi:cytochrome P450 [Trametes elegans]|nr:cytochrome P450 [Trametes elegans]
MSIAANTSSDTMEHLSVLTAFTAFGLGFIVLWAIRRRVCKSSFRNIPGPAPASWWKCLLRNVHQLNGRHGAEQWFKQLAETYGLLTTIAAPFGRTWLHVYDPKALYAITIKDQDVWGKSMQNFNKLLIVPGLLTTEGAQHRKQRKMLTPVFSTAYLRNVTPLFYETAHKLRDAMQAELRDGPQGVDVLRWMGRAALELVGQGLLGCSFDPLVEDIEDSFGESVKASCEIPEYWIWPPASGALNSLAILRLTAVPFIGLGPAWFRRKIVDALPIDRVQRMKGIVDTMHRHSVEIMDEKRRATRCGNEEQLAHIGDGKDVMTVLLRANMMADAKEKLSDDELVAQISTFILAGMDTTSNAASRILHILAEKPAVQDKLRREVLEAQYDGEILFDRLMELPYLDAVCRETLRLYVSIAECANRHSPVRLLNRCALQDTVLPLQEPIRGKDGTLISQVTVPKGTFAILNLWASNTNKALWGEDAYEWKPERWFAPLPRAIEEARVPGVYSHLMSFRGGGRSCIGFKYAQLELKVILSVLLSNFGFELTEKPICWNHAGVMYPTAGKESRRPEMPMRVSQL